MKHWYYIVSLWAFLAIGCDPCNDCGEPFHYDPLVSVIFINQDSADILNDSIAARRLTMEQIDSVRRLLSLRIDSLEDSLAVINALIDSGEEGYEDEQLDIENSIADILPEFEQVNEERGALDSLNKYYAEILTLIRSGNVQVGSATLLNTGSVILYGDSALIYNVPLLMDVNETSYEFKIKNKSILLHFTYDLEQTVSDSRIYRINATDIKVDSQDSVRVKCLNPDNCLSNETTVTVYF